MEQKKGAPRPTPFPALMNAFIYLKDSINLEDQLDLQYAEVPNPPILPQISTFNNAFKLNNGPTTIPEVVVKIKKDAFKLLYDEVVKLRKPENHITCLRIWHGLTKLTTEHKLKPLFQVIYTVKSATGQYSVVEGSEIYHYDGNVFKPYSGAEDLRRNYRENIRIKKITGGSYDPLNVGLETESVTFPFQTIFTLILDNLPDNDDAVIIVNSLATNKEQTEIYHKHALLLFATKMEEDQKGTEAFVIIKDKYANRSHLCPPGCDKILDFDLA